MYQLRGEDGKEEVNSIRARSCDEREDDKLCKKDGRACVETLSRTETEDNLERMK